MHTIHSAIIKNNVLILGGKMNIYQLLKKDHKKVSHLFKKIIAAPNATARLNLFETVLVELSIHAAAEQKTFYKALKSSKKGKEEASHAIEEHHEIKDCLNKVVNSDPNSNGWLIHFGELKSIVEHHVKEEEGDIFKTAKKSISTKKANELAVNMLDAKKIMLNALKNINETKDG